jgi:hypothetical protein
MPSHPLPANDELRTRMVGFYLGDDDLASRVKWLYARARRCHVLCRSDTEAAHSPEPIVLHGVFSIARQPFKLLPDGGFAEKTMPDSLKHATITEAMARTNAWARLEQVRDKALLGFDDFPRYIKNVKAIEALMPVGGDACSLITDDGVRGPRLKIIHRMFDVRILTTFSFVM